MMVEVMMIHKDKDVVNNDEHKEHYRLINEEQQPLSLSS